jgi:hypothetical protein
LSNPLSVEPAQVMIASAEASAAIAAATTHEAAVSLPQIAEITATACVKMPLAETVRPIAEAMPPAPPPPPVEAPRFDPLAFIRAAAMENLST